MADSINVISLELPIKHNLSLRLTGNHISVSFLAYQIYKSFKQIADKKGYSLSMSGYKNNNVEAVMQVYIALSNPETSREPRGRTTQRIVLEPEDIVKSASKFVGLDRKNAETIEVRVQAKAAFCVTIREWLHHACKRFLETNSAQLELTNIRDYKNQRIETMDIQIFC